MRLDRELQPERSRSGGPGPSARLGLRLDRELRLQPECPTLTLNKFSQAPRMTVGAVVRAWLR